MPRQQLKQRSDGRYACKYKGIFFYGETAREAMQKRDVYKLEEAQGIKKKKAGQTFGEYALEWLDIYHRKSKARTYNEYAVRIERMCKEIGGIKLKELTQSDIKRAYNIVEDMSDSYIKKYAMTLRNICACAYADGACARDPAQGLAAPKGESGTHRALTSEEVRLVMETAPQHRFGAMAMTMLFSGLRRGEALALDIDKDVDFINRVIHVRGAIAFEGNTPVLTRGKTYSALRDVPLLPPLRSFLITRHGLLLSGATKKYATETICTGQFDSFIHLMERKINGSQKRWYGRTKEHRESIAAGRTLPPWKDVTIRMHDFRHTYCVMLFDAGVDMKTAQKWMGHADATMIMRIYDHLSKIRTDRSTDAMVKLVEKLVENDDRVSKRVSSGNTVSLKALK